MCINKGVGAQRETIAFTCDSDTMNHAITSGEYCENQVTVEVVPLDAALVGESPALIKIDVEGFETSVLEGAHQTLQKQTLHSVIMELNGSGSRYGFDESRIFELMADYGFETYSYDPFERALISLKGKNLHLENTLYIRGKSFVEERLKSSPKVKVHGSQF